MSRNRWVLVGILAVATALRFGWGVATLDEVPETWIEGGDQYSYWYYGNEIADGNGYISYTNGEATSYYPIGFPATLAALFWLQEHTPLPDHQPTAVAVFNALLSTASVFFVFLIARAAHGVRAGLVAAALTALTTNLVLYVASYALETSFVFWSTAALAVLVTHDWANGPPSWRRVLGFGAVLAVSGMVRPFSLPFLLALVVGVLVARGGWRRALASAGLAIVPALALVIPWTIRNLDAMDAFVPISTNLGDTACLDRSLESDGGFAWAAHDGCADPTLPEAERSRENIGKAIDFVVTHPMAELELMGKRLWRMLEHDHSGLEETEGIHGRFLTDGWRRAITGVSDATFWVLFGAGVLGLWALFRRGDPATRVQRLAVGIAFLVLLALPIGLWGNPRFHVPLLPLLAVSAASLSVPRRGVAAEPAGNNSPAWKEPSISHQTSSSPVGTG